MCIRDRIKPSAQPNPLLKDKDALRACESQIFWWRREDRWRRWRQLQSRIRKHIVKEKKEKKVEAGKETKDPKDEKEYIYVYIYIYILRILYDM